MKIVRNRSVSSTAINSFSQICHECELQCYCVRSCVVTQKNHLSYRFVTSFVAKNICRNILSSTPHQCCDLHVINLVRNATPVQKKIQCMHLRGWQSLWLWEKDDHGVSFSASSWPSMNALRKANTIGLTVFGPELCRQILQNFCLFLGFKREKFDN